jgi:cobalt-zinc-cadmium efflux system membrane fusion protein
MNDKIIFWVNRNKILLILTVIFFVAGFFLGRKSTSHNFSADATDACIVDCKEEQERCSDERSDHGIDDHSGHAHSTEAVSLDELEEQTCEHQIGIVDCDECRYEVGVVKIELTVAEALIDTGSVENVDRKKTLRFTGQVQLDRTKVVEVVPTGGGRVEQVEKFLGHKVQKGDILAVLHSDDLGQAKADFLEIQAALELAEATFNREKNLYEKKISSQADYLASLKALKAAQASCAAVDKKLRLFGLETEQIMKIKNEEENGSFADLVLRAPQAGTLIEQNISVGQIVGTSESIFTIADLSNLWVWCDVYEKDLAVLHEQTAKDKSLEAIVKVKAFELKGFIGKVDFVGNLMDEHTRTVKMRVQVKNPDHQLRPGMFADVQIAISQDGQMLAVPQTAVMADAGENFVFQHWKNDLWVRRDVMIGGTYGNIVELLSGVPQGAKIVTGGAFMLKSDVLREKMGAGCAD